MKFVQAYVTTNYPVDEGGNYYYVAYVPEDAPVQLPVTKVAPDPELGDKGLKFDWTNNRWQTSEQDPTLKLLKQLQTSVKSNDMVMLNMMKDQLMGGMK